MWKVEYSKKFLKEFFALPESIQARIKSIVFQELKAENPFYTIMILKARLN